MAEKSKKSDCWFVRVDGPKEFLEAKLRELSNSIDCLELLGAFHLGEKKDNPHAHFCIRLNTIIQKQSFALRVKKLFSIEKKSQYALEVWDGLRDRGAVSYLFHEEGVVIMVNKGFSEENLDNAQRLNQEVQRVVAVNKQRASGRLVERVLKEFTTFNKREILIYMLQEIKDGNAYYPGEFRLKQMLEEIQLKLCSNVEAEADRLLWKWN